METSQRRIFKAGVVLAIAALVGTASLSFTSQHSKPHFAENQRQQLLNTLSVVIPPDRFDNDLLNDVIEIADAELLGMPGKTIVYRARLKRVNEAVAFRIVAPDGYSGAIDLLIAIRADGALSGVRVIGHRETPGLGDAIEAQRSDWILGFDGKSLQSPDASGWKVKRDGGQFDQFTGATITPRAVVKAVHNGLLFFNKYREQLFAQQTQQADSENVATVR